MNLTCERDLLLERLSDVATRARSRVKVPILNHVKLSTRGQTITLAATDLETRSETTFAAEVAEQGVTTVHAERLLGLVNGLPQGSQVRIVEDDNQLNIFSGKSRYKLPTLPAEDFPVMDRPKDAAEFTLTADVTKRLFGEPATAIPVKDTRFYLMGGHLTQRGEKEIAITCTDGMRLARLTVDADVTLGAPVIVPKPAMTEIVKLATGGDITFRCGQNLIEVQTPAITFISKLIDATYPDADRVIPQAGNTYINVDRKDLLAALKRLAGLEDENSTVNIEWKSGQQSLELNLSGEGSGAETVACECDLNDGAISFKPSILRSMLDLAKGEIIQLHAGDASGPMRVIDPGDPGLVIIAMPCRAK